ncbi:MAG: alpha-N-arabinofuranosidase [Fimbriimonadaceae bacterium]
MPLLSTLAFVLCTSVSQSQSITAKIDASRTSAPISPYVYGMFLEHIGSLITGSIWAEMLDDRKFYKPIPSAAPEQTGGPRFGRGQLRPWTLIGPASSVSMDTVHVYTGKHSPLIALSGSEPRGIEQAGLSLVGGKSYVGRVVLCGSPDAHVSVSLVAGSRRQRVTLGRLHERYTKVAFRFTESADAENARFQIEGTGSGSFEVGAVSLMPTDNIEGFRPEVIGVLKQLHSGVYRFPGGNFVSAHEWRNAIGDIDRRPPTFDPVWRAVQPNDVGTDEFMRFCKLIDVEPYITLNAGFGDEWSARDYVEYCNGDSSTPMGRLRSQNGHRDPYHVKFWGIGNEAWGYSYQFGAMKLAQFEVKHNEFADAMRKVDPAIKLIGSGAMGDTMTGSKEALNLGDSLIPKPLGPADWTGGLFAHCLNNLDLISEHFYNYRATHFSLAQAKQIPNDPNEPLVDWMRRPANHIKLKVEEYEAYEKLIPALKTHPVPICLDEWAYAGGPPNSYRVVPAYAWALHEMFRRSDLYQMACLTFATATYDASKGHAVLDPVGMLFKLYHDHFGSIPVAVTGNSPQPKPTDPPGGEQPASNAGSDTYPLDVVAAWTADHKTLTLAVLNLTEQEQSIDLNFSNVALSGKGGLWRMAPDSLNAVTAVGRSEVKIDWIPVSSVPGRLHLPKFSVSIYDLAAH